MLVGFYRCDRREDEHPLAAYEGFLAAAVGLPQDCIACAVVAVMLLIIRFPAAPQADVGEMHSQVRDEPGPG
jgi:hypothetical protein